MRRDRYLNLRLPQEEACALTEKARAARLSKSALRRDHLGRVRISADRRDLPVPLRRIGILSTRSPRWANTYKTEAEALEILDELRSLKREVLRLASAARAREVPSVQPPHRQCGVVGPRLGAHGDVSSLDHRGPDKC